MGSIGELSGDEECHQLKLARRVASKDSTAWDELQSSVLPWLDNQCRYLCYRYGVPEIHAEDVGCELLYALIKRLEEQPAFLRKTDCSGFFGYLKQAAHNRVYSLKNTMKRMETHGLCGKPEGYTERRLEELEESDWIEHVVSFHSPYDQQILRARLNGCSSTEIAEKFGTTAGAVDQKILRLIKSIGRFVGREER